MRISQGPHAALSIPEAAGPDEVRAAFLQLTKQFHPARFGRMSGEIQRLANEVFLGIKSAHDQLMKLLLGASGRIPQMRRAGTPPIDGASVGGTVRGTGLLSRIGSQPAGTTQPLARGTSPIDAGTQRGGTDRGVGRPGSAVNHTPPAGTQRPSSQPATGQATQPLPATSRTSTGPIPRVTPASGIPIQRLSTPAIDPPTNRPRTGESQPIARQSSSHIDPPTNRPAPQRNTPVAGTPIQRPASPPVINPPTIRYTSPQPTQQLPRTGTADEQAELKLAFDRLNAKDWAGARLVLHTLAARAPQSKHFRALLCYARGRETQATGRVDDALVEFQRALQLDPDLEIAKQAIRELQRKSRL
jgi:hypothetical protein